MTIKYIPSLNEFEWQPAVLDKDLATPPESPSKGDRYIVADSATGDWTGQENNIALYTTEWVFITAKEGMKVWVKDENKYYFYNGTNWILEDYVQNADIPAGDDKQVQFNDGGNLGADEDFEYDKTNNELKVAGIEAKPNNNKVEIWVL